MTMAVQTDTLPQPNITAKPRLDDRKAILPRRIIKISLSLARLKPGRYIYIVDVPHEGDLQFEQGVLQSA